MLTLVKIEAIHPRKLVATLDRDGTLLSYEFDVTLAGDGSVDGVGPPEHMYWDLIDYDTEPKPGGPPGRGAINIPAIRVVRRLVFDFADGDKVDLPIVLDER